MNTDALQAALDSIKAACDTVEKELMLKGRQPPEPEEAEEPGEVEIELKPKGA